jgi:epoxyqueuosine reductase
VFGCDICQQVCPWNRHAPGTQIEEFRPRADLHPLSLAELFDLDEQQFRERFRQTPLWRAKRRGLLRNAAMVLGNQRDGSAIDALGRGLHDEEPVVRAACAWALGRINSKHCIAPLQQRLTGEEDEVVRHEIEQALEAW